MSIVQATGVIRNRGQLTIPDAIRTLREWVSPSSVVTITSEKPDEIVIRPHQNKHQVDWDTLWQNIKLARSFKGKGGNLSAFIATDREKH